MIKDRKSTGIHCSRCMYSNLCIANNLPEGELFKLNQIMSKMYIFDSGQHIYHQKQNAKYIYALYSGCCKEYYIDHEGDEVVKNFYFPGDLLAIESFTEQEYHFSALAIKPTQLCAIPKEEFLKLMNENESILKRYIHIINKKLNNDNSIPVTTNARRRTAAFLLNIFTRIQQRKREQNYIRLPMSQFEISNFLGLAHETVSRILHSFQKNKIIKILNKNIYIDDIDLLKSIAKSS